MSLPTPKTHAVRMLLTYYEKYYLDIRRCGCDVVQYPNGAPDEEGIVRVCTAHRWLDMRDRAMQYLVNARLSRPLPGKKTIDLIKASQGKEVLTISKGAEEIHSKLLDQNPLKIGPELVSYRVASPTKLGIVYADLVKINNSKAPVHTREHAPLLISSKMVLDLQYSHEQGSSTAADEALLYAPILILVDSGDKRLSFENIMEPLYSRQYGIAFVFKGKST